MHISIFVHSLFMLLAFAVSFPILWGRKGNKRHKSLGWIFTASMLISTISTFFIPRFGAFSYIHILSIFVLFWLIRGILAARFKKGNWQYIHSKNMGSAYIGIIIAGIGVLIRYSSTPVNYINGYIASSITACVAIPILIRKIQKYKRRAIFKPQN